MSFESNLKRARYEFENDNYFHEVVKQIKDNIEKLDVNRVMDKILNESKYGFTNLEYKVETIFIKSEIKKLQHSSSYIGQLENRLTEVGWDLSPLNNIITCMDVFPVIKFDSGFHPSINFIIKFDWSVTTASCPFIREITSLLKGDDDDVYKCNKEAFHTELSRKITKDTDKIRQEIINHAKYGLNRYTFNLESNLYTGGYGSFRGSENEYFSRVLNRLREEEVAAQEKQLLETFSGINKVTIDLKKINRRIDEYSNDYGDYIKITITCLF